MSQSELTTLIIFLYLNNTPEHEHSAVVNFILDSLVEGAVQGQEEA